MIRDDFWESPNVNSKLIHSVCHVFYPPAFAEASAGQVGKVEDTASLLLSRVRGNYYSFTLDASDLQHPQLFQR